MPLVREGNVLWFTEGLYPDTALRIKVSTIIEERITRDRKGKPLQRLGIYDTPRYGKMVVLGDVRDKKKDAIQTTEADEALYHEVLHCGANSCAAPPKTILLIGCDGGMLREALKHNPRRVDVVDIDREVIDLVKKHIPSIPGDAWKDRRRVRLTIEDGAEFVKRARRRGKLYNFIVIDSPDPIGPAVSLFRTMFYLDVARILAPGGVVIRQTGSSILQPDEMPSNFRQMQEVFPRGSVQVFTTAVATYVGGYFTFVAASPDRNRFQKALRTLNSRLRNLPVKTFRWYSASIHRASMALPRELEGALAMTEFGREIIVDLKGCDYEKLNSPEEIKRFAGELCKVINMVPFGKPWVPDFGHAKSRTAGPSLVQLIETSSITGHYGVHWLRLCLNVFTCSTLEALKAVKFSMNFFGAKHAEWELRRRGTLTSQMPKKRYEYETLRGDSGQFVTTRHEYWHTGEKITEEILV